MHLGSNSVAGACLGGTGRSGAAMTYFLANPRWFLAPIATNEEKQSSAASATGFSQPKSNEET
jgi:hypothetical protein